MMEYYKAYDERYKIAHAEGLSWEYLKSTPIILEIIKSYGIIKSSEILEIGCGEGRDSKALLAENYNLLAVDVAEEAISFCKSNYSEYKDSFITLDCLKEILNRKFDFIFSVAVIHMLVDDNDRSKFYSFIYNHLKDNGIALILSMGDGLNESSSDVTKAFDLTKRNHYAKELIVPETSCRIVSFDTFEKELKKNNLKILEKGITSALPNFNSLMYAVVKR